MDATDDYWHLAVKLLTGYEAPTRDVVFDDLLGNQKIPLMKIEFSDFTGNAESAVLSAIDDMQWRVQNSGWRIENTDFVVPFFSGMGGPVGDLPAEENVKMKKARVTLLGTSGTEVPAGGVWEGGEFKSHLGAFDDLQANQQWSDRKLTQYSFGGGRALEALLGTTQSTVGFSWNGISVQRTNAVSLKSFDDAARAFDRSATFFDAGKRELADWEFDLGTEQAAWKGQAAGVFRDLIHGLNRNYEGYAKQLGLLYPGTSKYGSDLRKFALALQNAATNLKNTWETWALFTGNPLRWLHDVLLEVTDYMWYHNITNVKYNPDLDTFKTETGFTGAWREFGPLEDTNTWKKIGEEALRRWQQCLEDQLVRAGQQALVDIQNSWNDQTFIPVTTSTVNLEQEFQKDQADKEKADQKAYQDETLRKQDEERKRQEEREKEQDRKQKEREEKEDQIREEQEAKQDRIREEQEAKQDQIRKDQEAKQAEQEAKQDRIREEQEAKQDQIRKEQEAKQAEQEAKQEEAQRRQEQAQQEAQAQQQAMYLAQQQKQKEQEEKQDRIREEQEAKQDQIRKEQEAKQEQQRQEQKEEQAQQEAKQDQIRKEQEAKQEQQRQEQEARQKEQEEKQDRIREEQDAKQDQIRKEQETKQDQIRKEQETKQEQQRQEQKEEQARQEAKQDRIRKEQEAKQAEQEAKQDRIRKEQDAKQDQIRKEQDAKQAEAQARYGDQIGNLDPTADLPQVDRPDGWDDSTSTLNPDGSITTEYPDGSSTTVNPRTGETTVTLPDGHRELSELRPGESMHNSDGSWSTRRPDGSLTTDFPDGTSTTYSPHTGEMTTVFPEGTKTVTHLDPSQAFPSHPDNPYASAPDRETYALDGELYDSRASADDAASSLGSLGGYGRGAGGSSLGSMGGTGGGMPMLPMGTHMNGTTSGGPGSGERLRQVFDYQPETVQRRRPAAQQDEQVAAAQRGGTATSGTPFAPPMMPPGGGGGQQDTQSGTRERESWLTEDEDVWGADGDGSPASIGRE
jgi:hypothetical protein